jgi:ectoine hydroxylase-related dioxygenase (phytanoyl-CoA dioxygenase family)
MTMSKEIDAFLPSDAEVALYRVRGYHVSPKVLPDDVIDEAALGAERHFAGERDSRLPIEDGFADWKPGDPDDIRNSEFVALRNAQVRALALRPVIGAIAARLAGTGTIRMWDDQLIWKAPAVRPGAEGRSVVGWHTDRAYWMTCTSDEMLTAWIPFHDCPAEIGPVMYVEGSHLWPDTEAMRTFKTQNLEELERRFIGDEAGSLIRIMELEKGQISFHHSRMIHGSDLNRGRRPRLSYVLHMQDESNRWRPYVNDEGGPLELINDRMARKDADGNPDYADPSIFPVLWSRTDPAGATADRGAG